MYSGVVSHKKLYLTVSILPTDRTPTGMRGHASCHSALLGIMTEEEK